MQNNLALLVFFIALGYLYISLTLYSPAISMIVLRIDVVSAFSYASLSDIGADLKLLGLYGLKAVVFLSTT